MVHRVERQDVVDTLSRAAAETGLDLDRFVELGRSDELDDPRLRDLWLIWGDVFNDSASYEDPPAA